MSQKSLADTLIDWAILAVRAAGTLPFDLQINPFVSSDDAKMERIVVKCETGAQIQEACQPFECQMTFSYHTATRDETVANDVFAKVEASLAAAMSTTAGNAYAGTIFKLLIIHTEQAQTSLENSPNIRHYTRSFPLKASLL